LFIQKAKLLQQLEAARTSAEENELGIQQLQKQIQQAKADSDHKNDSGLGQQEALDLSLRKNNELLASLKRKEAQIKALEENQAESKVHGPFDLSNVSSDLDYRHFMVVN